MYRLGRIACVFAITALKSAEVQATEPPLDGPGPYTVDTSLNVSIALAGQTLSVDLYAPEGAPPAPIIVGAHGLEGTKEDLSGWGTHFASQGFAFAIPQFIGSDQTAAPANAASENALLDWIQAQGVTSGTFFSGRVDGSKRGIIGHSMGGLVEFLAASASPAIQVAVGLDPVDVNSMAADAVPMMQAFPEVLKASTLSVCNLAQPAEAAVVAAFPGPYLWLTVANTMHCDPQDPEMSACVLSCTATVSPPYTCSPNPASLSTFMRYGTAAMRYFLMCDSLARANIDGAAEQVDADAGTVFAVTTHNIPAPGGCWPPDAGTIIVTAETDAGEPADSGPIEPEDSGVIASNDAGTESADASVPAAPDAGGTSAGNVPHGCGCSGFDEAGLAALAGLLVRRRRSFRSVVAE